MSASVACRCGSQGTLNVLINGQLLWDQPLFAWQSPANKIKPLTVVVVEQNREHHGFCESLIFP
jgi:hypothetical protein